MKRIVAIGIIFMLIFSIPVNITYPYEKAENGNFINRSNDGRTLYVGGNGPNNYTRIQDAVDDASDGDTIFVYSGVYNESINLDKSINLIGESKEKTIIYAVQGYAINVTGIRVNIANFTITNASWEYASVIIYKSEGNMIFNCNFYNNDWIAIEIYFSNENKILNCNISKNSVGIQLRYSKDNEILNCNVSYNGEGMWITHSDGNKVSECIFYENKWSGISIDYSLSNKILNNVFVDNGIRIYGEKLLQFVHNIYNNTVNGLPLLYIKNEKNVILEDIEAGEVIIVNCNASRIKNIAINNSDIGIEVAYCNNNTITDCTISNTYEGILLLFSSHNVISNNSISNSNESGISLNTCDNNIIIGNRVTNTYNDAIF
ncbi:MAG: right-handed parallel beta-helix repeat-containing protein, partial [Thermoplasmata archaeon]|nr:right-handed parallel beta-helix repeat-containing protein [Thermoplasmata archaeon]